MKELKLKDLYAYEDSKTKETKYNGKIILKDYTIKELQELLNRVKEGNMENLDKLANEINENIYNRKLELTKKMKKCIEIDDYDKAHTIAIIISVLSRD